MPSIDIIPWFPETQQTLRLIVCVSPFSVVSILLTSALDVTLKYSKVLF